MASTLDASISSSINISSPSHGGLGEEIHASESSTSLNSVKQSNKDANVNAYPIKDKDKKGEISSRSSDDIEKGDIVEGEYVDLENDSPYPEVRASVPSTDDPSMRCNTIRMWTIGFLFATVGSAVNMFFSLRNPPVTITVLIAQLVAYPCLKGWDLIFPDRQFRIGRLRFNFKPAPFNMKEHTLIVIMSSVSFGSAYSTDIILSQRAFYKQRFGFGYEICLTLATQLIGYGLAGVSRKILVRPASMVWPSNLVNCALMKTLHLPSKVAHLKSANGWNISAYRFFLIAFAGCFFWTWFPNYIFTALSLFAWVTWIKPKSPVVNQLFGESTGISLIPITFDWNSISGYLSSPLMFPSDAIFNTLISTVLFFWIVTLGVHYSNVWYGSYLPICSNSIVDHFGSSYNVSRILTPDFRLDLKSFQEYSPLFMPSASAVSFGLSFASMSAVIFHVVLYYGKDIWARIRNPPKPDIHERLMEQYKEVPFWWYLSIFIAFFGMMMGVCYGWPTETPAWVVIVGLIFAAVWFIPVGVIYAITNVELGMNVFTEYIVGYMYPGHPLANMIFKTVGYITQAQALAFVSDLKLGHYMKVPPRMMFWTQTLASIWSCFVQIGVLDWALGNIKNVCDPGQTDGYTCPGAKTFFNSSVIWGVIGPQRMFSGQYLYTNLQYFWLAGALSTVLFWALWKKWPQRWWGKLSAPIIFGGTGMLPPATPTNYLVWCGIGIFFNYFIKKRFYSWWAKYNFNLSAALDTGMELALIIIFFCLQLPNVSFPSWWGNVGAFDTMDASGTAVLKTVNETAGEFFGPTKW
ncbi:plasma membrane OPT oligopeptide transmembrane transporter family Isp4 [Schizosaccharomyces osmophilus]|uniref:Plasma membrane OPT oligopeptide transmembrane transporter family Isp4 n=1 Tax=Schizosaccharomyces osmophilus TaxID=2545709 RepID=A0AAE9W8Q2_9SCHI|nr:plasma membrane OPT oligopeptide transmembrane transporter family Isp4 [Schizosaccharomyces osmophilus]WBW70896.1 plasma membrane OPT oligopeptide transmembrane transporter family Isp4 [Schizosaccharomyces osmophilus]